MPFSNTLNQIFKNIVCIRQTKRPFKLDLKASLFLNMQVIGNIVKVAYI